MNQSISGPSRRNTLFALAVAAVGTTTITAGLHARVADEDPKPRAPMPIRSEVYELASRYEREQQFLGLIQAATQSEIGFEVPGAVAAMLVNEGDAVDAGAPLAKLDTQALDARRDAAASTLEQIRAELELARARTARQAPLKDSGAISEQTFDDTRLTEKALESRLNSAQAQLRALEIDIEKSTLRAPYAARIARRLLDRGAVTQPGTPVFTLVATAEREAHIGVAVEQADALEPGREYPLNWRGETVMAKLRAVRPDVNPVSMTTAAIFELPPALEAFDGEPVTVSLPRTVAAKGGWLPLSALLEGDRGVWTVLALREEDEGTVAQREAVEVLHISGDRVYVRGTLNAGDQVVADGVHRIAPGTRVRPLDSEEQLARR